MNLMNPLSALDTLSPDVDFITLSPGLQPEEALALAIVLQALQDWRQAMGILSRSPDHARAKALLQDTEAFLRSRWFRQLLDVDGDALLRSLRAEYSASVGLRAGRTAASSAAPAKADPLPARLRALENRQAAFRRRALRRRKAG